MDQEVIGCFFLERLSHINLEIAKLCYYQEYYPWRLVKHFNYNKMNLFEINLLY